MLFFLWNDALVEHAERHGVRCEVAEYVVRNAQEPYPEYIGDGKYRVWGLTRGGVYVQVVFARRELGEIEWDRFSLPMLAAVWDDDAVFIVIVHAMPMTDEMKKSYRSRL